MTANAPAQPNKAQFKKRRRPVEALIKTFMAGCGVLSIATTVGLVVVLAQQALLFFFDPEVSLGEFVTGTNWQPAIGHFGIWPLILATLTVSIIAMIVALPLGLASAVFLSEYATPRVRSIIKPTLEVLAGIPTVVFGYFALTFMTPLLRSVFPGRRPIATGYRTGLSSRKRQFESGRDYQTNPRSNWGLLRYEAPGGHNLSRC